ncbi:MAG: exo-alpha-sialidase, partial [Armatimonadetes bacterium]|nr:exo-alpha-sialidase [Candidatus Hippobium faecium]
MKYIILILVLMFSVSLYAEGSDVYRGLQKIERSEIFRSGNNTRKEKNMTEAQTFAKCTAYPNPFYYEESVREFQGIPTVAVSPKGRIFLAWEAGGDHEPDPRQYLIVHYSDDEGETWSDPIYVIDCDRDRKIWVGDIQLWTSPEGDIHIYWAQDDWFDWNKESFENNIMVPDFGKDTVRYTWRCVCKNPDSVKPVFSEPEYIFDGCMRGRPKAVKSGRIFYPTYDENKDTFIYTYSDDGGKTFFTKNGGKKIATDGDEPEIFEREDGSLVRMQRTVTGFIGQAFSYDNGDTWTDGENSS